MLAMAATDDASAQTSAPDRATNEALAARAQAQPRRVRPRIRVTPAYPYRLQSTDYPTPYAIEYPGPGRGAAMHVMAGAGIPPERPGHHAADALLVGAVT